MADAAIVAVQPGDDEREEREDLHPGAGAAPVPQARQRQRLLLDGDGGVRSSNRRYDRIKRERTSREARMGKIAAQIVQLQTQYRMLEYV